MGPAAGTPPPRRGGGLREGQRLADPLEWLVDSTRSRLRTLAQKAGQPVPVFSHSVGAVLAIHLLRHESELIESVTLINPTFDLELAFVRLARQARRLGMVPPAVEASFRRLESERGGFVEWGTALNDVPDRFNLYWAKESDAARLRYLSLAPSGPPLDIGTFVSVGSAIQAGRAELTGITSTVPVVALIGNQDPMLSDDPAGDVHTRLPSAEVRVVVGSHMTVFEQPIAQWAPGLVDSA